MAARHRAPKTVKDVYRGYMPIDLPQHRPPQKIKPWWRVIGKPRVTLYPKERIEGYSEEPEYPELNDGSKYGLKKQIRLDWYESLKVLPTFDQKLYEINRHTDHYIAHINNWLPRYNSLPMIKYLTRTHMVDSLPKSYALHKNHEDNLTSNQTLLEESRFQDLKRALLDQIATDKYNSIKEGPFFVSNPIRDGNRKSYVSNQLVENIALLVKKALAYDINTELLDYHYELKPAIRSWWYHSGFRPPNNKIFYNSRKDEDGNINQLIQMDGSAALTIRSNHFLEPVISQSDNLVTDTSLVQNFNHPLRYYGAVYKFKRLVALAGYWPDLESKQNTFDFPHTCFLSTDCLKLRNSKQHQVPKLLVDDEDCLNGQAILTAFSWMNSLSMYHGYTPFQELHYPFTCQVVSTDGQYWTFHIYQLNNHSFHRDFGPINKNNVCWTSGQLRLYENYEDGQFMGVNEDVLKLLIRFMSQKTNPAYTAELELRKYLREDNRTEEEKLETREKLKVCFEGRSTKQWLKHQWKVPLYEHMFFRSKEMRHRIRHMKPVFHVPKPQYPKMFE